MEQEVGIREQLEYCISLEELSAKLRVAGATKFLAEKLDQVSKKVEDIRQNHRTSKKDREKVDKTLNEYKMEAGRIQTEFANFIKQSEAKIQYCEKEEIKCISNIAKMQNGSKDLLAKQKNDLKEAYANKVEEAKDLKKTDPVIMYLRAKKILAEVKRNSVLYMDIKEYEKAHKMVIQAQENDDVKKYLELMEEIPSLKKDIKYIETAKTKIQEYDNMLNKIKQLKKDGKNDSAKSMAAKVKKMEDENIDIREYKEAKLNLKSIQNDLEQAKSENTKLKTAYKKQPENIREKYTSKIKKSDAQIKSLQNKAKECKESIKQYTESDTEIFKRDLSNKQKELNRLKNSPELEVYFNIEKDFKKKQLNKKIFHEVEEFNIAKDNLAKSKMDINVTEYLNLMDEIAQLKVQIKESKKGKTTNIIKEYEVSLKTAKKFGKAGRMNEYKEAMRDIREKESNATVQEYKYKKAELTTIREDLENAHNSRAGAIVAMNIQLEQILKPAEQSLMVAEKVNPVKKLFTSITSKLNLGLNTEKNVISPLMTISSKLSEISQGIRANAEQNFRNDVIEILKLNGLEKCSTLDIVERFTRKKKSDAQRVEYSKTNDRQDTRVFQKSGELGFAR